MGKKGKHRKDDDVPCRETKRSPWDPAHTHTCAGNHTNVMHYCPVCKRWWGKKGS